MSFEENAEVADFRRREQAIILAGEQSVIAIQIFQPLPIKQGEDMVVGYYRRVHKPITPFEARVMARRDLTDLMDKLRPLLAPLLESNAISRVQAAALLHIGLVLNGGTGTKLERMKDLWPALRARDYEAAHDIVMLTAWPQLVDVDLASRRRVLALARMLRTGEMPTA